MYTGYNMPRASRKRIKKKVYEEVIGNFASLITALKNPYEIEFFFQDFLTKEEKLMLSKRLMLHLLLERGFYSSQIESTLGVSKETVRTHKNVWSRGGKVYKSIIQEIAKRNKTKEFWEKIEKLLKPVELVLQAKTNMKARAKFASGEWYDD